MNVFLWHVHGAWTTAFVHGDHDYYVPVTADRGPDGRGRADTYPWPERVHEVTLDEARDLDVDLIVLQRPVELERLAHEWLGRAPGRDVAAVYVEHNAPQGHVNDMRHPVAAAADDGIELVHVTHFNALFWDAGSARTRVIEHGVVEPGVQYDGALARAAVVINEPVRRARVTGTDLVEHLARDVPIDVFGMKTEALGGRDLSQAAMHRELARRRVYFHPIRWTSLGLSLIEAMHIGMPVVAVASTEVPRALPPGYPYASTSPAELHDALRVLLADEEEARARGKECREWAIERYGLERFLADWDRCFAEVAR
jgi:glycosyltransferase involved in cell wall biosynthesis